MMKLDNIKKLKFSNDDIKYQFMFTKPSGNFYFDKI